MSTEPISKDEFYTKEGNVKFTIKIDCKITLDDDNLAEITSAGSRRPHDEAIHSPKTGGLDIRQSLNPSQKQQILDIIKAITHNDPDYCFENDVIEVSDHIEKDYCRNNPAELEKRGWPTKVSVLAQEVTCMICNVTDVFKAKITFYENGMSKEKLTYTVVGSHKEYEGEFSIAFQSEVSADGKKETILTVTVLDRREKSQV